MTMVLFICSVVFFWEAVWEILRKVYAVTRKYQEMGFITNLEHILSHPWFAPVVGKLSHCCWGRQSDRVSQRPYSSLRVPAGKQKTGMSRCFHDLLKSWDLKVKAQPAAWEQGVSGSHKACSSKGERQELPTGQCRDARNCHPRRPAPCPKRAPLPPPTLRRAPSLGTIAGPPWQGSAGREEGCCWIRRESRAQHRAAASAPW